MLRNCLFGFAIFLMAVIFCEKSAFAETMKVTVTGTELNSALAKKIITCLENKINKNRFMELVKAADKNWDLEVNVFSHEVAMNNGKVGGETYFITRMISAFFGTNASERKLLIRDLNSTKRATLFDLNGGNDSLVQNPSGAIYWGAVPLNKFDDAQLVCNDFFEKSLVIMKEPFELHRTYYKNNPVDQDK